MTRTTKFAYLIAIFLSLTSCGMREEKVSMSNRTAVFCHVPFDVATSDVMTIPKFSHSCAYIGEINIQDGRFLEILKLIKQAKPGSFIKDGIRVKITAPDSDIIYIDDDGGVIMGATQVKIDPDGFARVKEIVTKMAEKSGLSLE